MIADTSGLLALFNSREPTHATVSRIVDDYDSCLVVSPFVVAELDYLVATRVGFDASLAVLDALSSRAFELPALDADDIKDCRGVIEQYADLRIGIADASLVILAERYQTKRLLTLDFRHFRAVQPLSGGHFALPSVD